MVSLNKKLVPAFVVLFCLVLLAFGFWFSLNYRIDSERNDIFNLTISPKWVNQAQFAGIFVAIEKGFYAEAGLDIEINEFSVGDSVLEDLEIGNSDLGLMSANEFLINYSKEKPIKALAAFYQVSPFIIASLKRDNITTPTELRGRVLGIKGGQGAESQAVFDLLLSQVKVKPQEVTFVNLPLGFPEKDDLLEGRAEAVGFYRTRLYQFDKEGLQYNLIFPEQFGAALYNDVLVARNDFLDKNGQWVKAFIKATIDGWRYAFIHKDEAVAITLKYVTDDAYLDPDYQRFILDESEALMDPTGERNFGEMDFDHWQRFYNVLLSKGVLDAPFDVNKSFSIEYLPK